MYRYFLSLLFLRDRRTNLIGITGIFVGVSALIMILSIMAGFLEESRKAMRGNLSDIIIEPRNALLGDSPRGPEQIIATALEDERVVAACPQLSWFGMISHRGPEAALSAMAFRREELAGVRLLGVDVEQEFATTDLRAALERESLSGDSRVENFEDPFAIPSNYRPLGRPLQEAVVVGEQLFDALLLKRGSEINIMTGSPDPESGEFALSNRWYVVAGTFRSGENESDLNRIYMQRTELADLLGPEQQYHQVLVKLADYKRDGEAVRESLHARLLERGLIWGVAGTEVSTWEDFRQTLLGAIENEKTLMAIMLSLVLIVAGFTVFAILSMMVTEKRRDIGILCALGATRGGILSLFLMIGFWDAFFGATLGAIAGRWAAVHIDPIERWLSSTFGIQIFNREVYLFDHIPSVVEPLGVTLIVLGAFVCTLVFAALPALKAARLDPIDALRYE